MSQQPDLEPLTFVATSDLTGITKGRLVPSADMTEGTSTGWVPANFGIGVDGHIVEGIPFDSSGDLRLLPDPDAVHQIRGVPGKPDLTVAIANVVHTDGTPWSCCTRTILRDTVAALQEEFGLSSQVAFEHEFADRDGSTAHHPFSWRNFRSAEPIGSHLVTAMKSSGLEPENWLPEYGQHQYEIVIERSAPVAAADRALLLRDMVRDVFATFGRRATFTPMTAPGGTGAGVHIHFSLQSADGSNPLWDPEAPGRLSELGGRFAAGILKYAPSLAAIYAPLTISYDRLKPHNWSSAGVFLGVENREALLRICPTVEIGGQDPEPQLHFEFRAGDIGANPWLLLAVVLRAGMEGLRQGLEPAEVVIGDPEASQITQLPGDLGEALEAFEADTDVREWLGEDLVQTYLAVKRVELTAVADMSDEEKCNWYADIY
ncbi:glutamine synthetase [Ornithinimicrobium ciconiae]|uniref:Glutamine synthetase n=1 Tax=Ornithinimicrobium ciconiae TaxID=2594265 RepID=A0A516GD31_9MICO|nr:glutamine synthetase family protein [Ornithinimicrobium ciconiae]QDO89433.1 glutamine synthetase [Ornithinimicrobium ciconiae]